MSHLVYSLNLSTYFWNTKVPPTQFPLPLVSLANLDFELSIPSSKSYLQQKIKSQYGCLGNDRGRYNCNFMLTYYSIVPITCYATRLLQFHRVLFLVPLDCSRKKQFNNFSKINTIYFLIPYLRNKIWLSHGANLSVFTVLFKGLLSQFLSHHVLDILKAFN